jgi:stalled ribosome rescue protein Dom34
MHKHAAIWLDHKDARIFQIEPDKLDEAHAWTPPQHIHHDHARGTDGAKEHPVDDKQFFQEIARSLDATEEILIVGPSTAKLEFIRYAHKHEHALEARIVGLETVDHPSDRQLVAYAKQYFERTD